MVMTPKSQRIPGWLFSKSPKKAHFTTRKANVNMISGTQSAIAKAIMGGTMFLGYPTNDFCFLLTFQLI
jgi:hypothetical protein